MSLIYVTPRPFLVYYLIVFCIAMHPMAGYATKGPLMDRVEYPQACHAALPESSAVDRPAVSSGQ